MAPPWQVGAIFALKQHYLAYNSLDNCFLESRIGVQTIGNSVTNDVKHHKMPIEDTKSTILVDKDDHTILKVYAKTLKMTITAALHHLLGIGAHCFEENHT